MHLSIWNSSKDHYRIIKWCANSHIHLWYNFYHKLNACTILLQLARIYKHQHCLIEMVDFQWDSHSIFRNTFQRKHVLWQLADFSNIDGDSFSPVCTHWCCAYSILDKNRRRDTKMHSSGYWCALDELTVRKMISIIFFCECHTFLRNIYYPFGFMASP